MHYTGWNAINQFKENMPGKSKLIRYVIPIPWIIFFLISPLARLYSFAVNTDPEL
jgi:hypothetical protein